MIDRHFAAFFCRRFHMVSPILTIDRSSSDGYTGYTFTEYDSSCGVTFSPLDGEAALHLPSGKHTKKLWKITIFNGKIHYKWSFSIATLNYQRVDLLVSMHFFCRSFTWDHHHHHHHHHPVHFGILLNSALNFADHFSDNILFFWEHCRHCTPGLC